MTGIQVGEKTKTQQPEGILEKMEPPRRSKSPLILTAVITCVITAVVIGTVVISLYFGTRMCNSSTKTTEPKAYVFQISDSPAAAKVEVHKPERVIITETSSTDKKLDHTVTLQDYNRDLQAVKDMNRKECYVFPVFYDFNDALKLSEDNTSIPVDEKPVELNMNRTLEAIPDQVLQHAVGTHIAEFCSDVPTYWLVHATSEDLARSKRRIRIRIGIRFRIFRINVRIGIEININ